MKIAGTTFYVAPEGLDTNPGDGSRPFRSIERARDAIRQRRGNGQGLDEDVSVVLRPGVYFQSASLQFDERDGGTNGHSVVYSGDPGGNTVVYGGTPVTGWERWKGGIYRAKVEPGRRFFRLFENGRPLVMARYPEKGSGYRGDMMRVGDDRIRVPEAWREYDLSQAQVYAMDASDWFSQIHEVLGFDRESAEITITPASNNWSPMFKGINDRFYIQGVLELLSQPGQWCLKGDEGYLYCRPRCEPIEDQLIVAPTVERVIDIRGSAPDRPVTALRFENIAFTGSDFCGSWRIFHYALKERDNTIPEPLRHGLITIENARGVEVRFCQIRGAGHSAVYLNHSVQDCTVYGCWIEDAGFAGVYLNGWAPGEGPFHSAAESDVNRRNRISNNFISDCGQFVGHGCGIQFFQSGENEITHNVIRRMPRYGISGKGGTVTLGAYGDTAATEFDYLHTRRNVIRYNDVANVCRDSHDYGAIELWLVGNGNIWENNAVHDCNPCVFWDGFARAFMPDGHTGFLSVRNNIVYECKGGENSSAVLMTNECQAVENNIFADNDFFAPFDVWDYGDNVHDMTAAGNILANCCRALFRFNVKDPPSLFAQVGPNLIFPAPAEPYWPGEFRQTCDEHHWGKGDVHADPMFDTKRPEHDRHFSDYRLKPDSPALKMGFRPIDIDAIGLKDDFPFDCALFGRRLASERIQAEDYDRMRNLRVHGNTGLCQMQPGAWVRYDNIDFGPGGFTRCCVQWRPDPSSTAGPARQGIVEFRLGLPAGEAIGVLQADQDACPIRDVRGIHCLYVCFPEGLRNAMMDYFLFENTPQGR
ncbi:MAG: right-handed parallel beta-helix repeat-containing protein [Planctomycetota bacterium]|nr:right-handed parallel beta-helix repeat-containing protein [Planctomycetota bacterium]